MQAMSKFIGIPFVDGGRDFNGCDCWGLSLLLFKELKGIDLPDYKISCDNMSKIDSKIAEQRQFWLKITLDELENNVPALVVMRFNSVTLCNHTGVYIGNSSFIHTSKRVNSHISSIYSPAWNRRIEGFYIPKM